MVLVLFFSADPLYEIKKHLKSLTSDVFYKIQLLLK